jgi:glutaryl-CoA dehydrogenase (non-decarboxylating)
MPTEPSIAAPGDGDLVFGRFVDTRILPFANAFDRDQALPPELLRGLGAERYIVASLPVEAGGAAMAAPELGMLHEQLGRGCGSVRNFVAVQGMVAHAIHKWGKREQRERWAPAIASGEAVGAFALTEPNVGSDARSVETTAVRDGAAYRLTGSKAWISFAAIADVFLLFARVEGNLGAFIVERNAPGLRIEPIRDLLGLRASSLARVHLDNCVVPAENTVSIGPFTFDAIATSALDYGRFSTACGCVGLAQACLDASLDYTSARRQFGAPLNAHALVQELLTNMVTAVQISRLQCREAGRLRALGDLDAVRQTLIAKYAASRLAFQTANDAVQLHGANGCGPDFPVQRHLRDAKIQEIIEGSSQIQQLQIADLTVRRMKR